MSTAVKKTIVRWTEEEREAIREHVYDFLIHQGKKFPITDGYGLAKIMHDGQPIVLPSITRHRKLDSLSNKQYEIDPLIEWLNNHHIEVERRTTKKLQSVPPPAAPRTNISAVKSTKKVSVENPFSPPPPAPPAPPPTIEVPPPIELIALLNRTLGLMEAQHARSMQQEALIQQSLLTTMQTTMAMIGDLHHSVRSLTAAIGSFQPNIHLSVEAPEGTKVKANQVNESTELELTVEKPEATIDDIPKAKKPRIVIYGLFPNQRQEIMGEYSDLLDVRCQESTKHLRLDDKAIKAYYLVKSGNTDGMTAARNFYGPKFESITGSTSMLKASIDKVLETLTTA